MTLLASKSRFSCFQVRWKRLGLELVLEALMVLAPGSVDLLAQMGEFLIDHDQPEVSLSDPILIALVQSSPEINWGLA